MLLLVVAAGIAITAVSPLIWWADLAILLLLGLFVLWWVKTTGDAKKELQRDLDLYNPATNWKLDVQPRNLWISPKDFYPLSAQLAVATDPNGAALDYENDVYLVTRRHLIFIWVPMLISAVVLGVLVFVVLHSNNGHVSISDIFNSQSQLGNADQRQIPNAEPTVPTDTNGQPLISGGSGLPTWVFLVLMLVTLLAAWIAWLKWRYSYLMITSWQVYRTSAPPTWQPFWRPAPQRVNYESMSVINTDNSRWGNWVGGALGRRWGFVVLDTPSAKDVAFNRIGGVPNHDVVAQIANGAHRQRLNTFTRPPS
jgi:hypothetical protein